MVRAARGPIKLPWEHRKRFELMDGAPGIPAVAPIVSDVGRLSYEQRVSIVLDRYAELSSGQIAEILQRSVDDVLLLTQRAQVALAAGQSERTSADALAGELKDAIPYDLSSPTGAPMTWHMVASSSIDAGCGEDRWRSSRCS